MKVRIGFLLLLLSLNALGQEKNNSDALFRETYPKAMAGEANAMFILGKIYTEGTSSAGKDQAKGLAFIQRASSAGNILATKYLIDVYERSNTLIALELCQRLQKSGDKYCSAKMDKLIEKSIPKTANAASCKKIGELYESGNQTPFMKGEITHCVLGGLSTTIPMDEAMAYLRLLAKDDAKAFLRLMPFLLKTEGPEWDPVYVEQNLTKIGLGYKDKEVRDLFVKNGITFDGCRKMERLRKETFKQRPAVCRMAALSGDEEAALYVGAAYLTGKDYFPEDTSEASIYIKEAFNSKNTHIATEAFALLVALYAKQNKFQEHLALVQQEIKRNTPNAKAALAAFSFEANYFQKNHGGMTLDDIQTVVAMAESNSIPQSIRSQVGKTIDEVIKDRGLLIRAIEKDMLMSYRGRLLSQKDIDEIEAAKAAALAATSKPVAVVAPVAEPLTVVAPAARKAEAKPERELNALERFFENFLKRD
jgi:hypothetical protein